MEKNFMYSELWIFTSSNGLSKIILTYQEVKEHGNKNEYNVYLRMN